MIPITLSDLAANGISTIPSSGLINLLEHLIELREILNVDQFIKGYDTGHK